MGSPVDEERVKVEITFVVLGLAGTGEEDAQEVRCDAAPGDNVLAVAMRCGAVDPLASEHFCLEGRCDSCMMTMEGEDDWAASEPVRACQVPVPDDGRRTIRLVVGGDGVGGGTWDDDFWGDNGWVDSDNPEEAAEGEEDVADDTIFTGDMVTGEA